MDEPLSTMYYSTKKQAALNNYDCIVALLLDFGADVNAKNVGGNTPLHVAATRNSKESVKWLLKRGARIDIENVSGKTAYEVGMSTNCIEASDLISNFNSSDAGNA
jgi:ankyrin repeat protein